MKIEGQFVFENAVRESAWAFLTDPERIAQCLPGCEKLIRTGEDTYELHLRIGIGAICGVFTGSIRLHALQPPAEYRMTVSGKGAPGFVNGEGRIQLDAGGATTVVQYSGEVSAGGAIASLGQRMIGGAARMVIDQFFRCAAEKLAG